MENKDETLNNFFNSRSTTDLESPSHVQVHVGQQWHKTEVTMFNSAVIPRAADPQLSPRHLEDDHLSWANWTQLTGNKFELVPPSIVKQTHTHTHRKTQALTHPPTYMHRNTCIQTSIDDDDVDDDDADNGDERG